MRLWSLHPRYLDRQGLTACWREGLLAQAVLAGRTKGYTRHPQLRRFQAMPDPVALIGSYLVGVADEADRRGYRFDRGRILWPGQRTRSSALPLPGMAVTQGQLDFEYSHLCAKLATRSPDWLSGLDEVAKPDAHPLFAVGPGGVAEWEVTSAAR